MAALEIADVKVDTFGQSSDKNFVSEVVCPDDQNPKSNLSVETSKEKNSEVNVESEIYHLSANFSKLNPMAEEYVPLSPAQNHYRFLGYGLLATHSFPVQQVFPVVHNGYFTMQQPIPAEVNGYFARRRRNFGQGRRRMNTRASSAENEDVIKKTVFVSDIDQQITEEQLAGLFLSCGNVVDCRICGEGRSIFRFAFIEFTDEEGARSALRLSGTVFGSRPLKVHLSKTAITPVNPSLLPNTEEEREKCVKTIYCTNIDKQVTQRELKEFFETACGEIQQMRLLGDYHHKTRIAFIEFKKSESATAALNNCGIVLGRLTVRVSPSKTPVRPHPSDLNPS